MGPFQPRVTARPRGFNPWPLSAPTAATHDAVAWTPCGHSPPRRSLAMHQGELGLAVAAEVLGIPLLNLGARAFQDVMVEALRGRLEDIAKAVQVARDLEVTVQDRAGRRLWRPRRRVVDAVGDCRIPVRRDVVRVVDLHLGEGEVEDFVPGVR